jgi:thymidylate synthase (FAD)
METYIVKNIEYIKPKVFLLQDTGIGTAEFAARTAYDSFDNSNDPYIQKLNEISIQKQNNISEDDLSCTLDNMNSLYKSDLLNDLAWTYFHHSVLEHAVLTFLIKDIGRGVLQELVRHRLASYTVKSTRYTMSTILNAYNAAQYDPDPRNWFYDIIYQLDMFITNDPSYCRLEIDAIYNKLMFQQARMHDIEWLELTVAKSSIDFFDSCEDAETLYQELEHGKKKRNVGDNFKHIVTDNWKTDIVMTINLRSLKNFFDLRDSGSAWFQIRKLAKEMKTQTPTKYLKLIDKEYRNN